MSIGDIVLFAAIGLMGVNHMATRVPGWERRRVLFWMVQLANLSAASGLMAFGIPGMGSAQRIVGWVIGLLFVVHILQNNSRLTAALRDGDLEEDSELEERRQRIHEALKNDQE